MYQNNDVRKNMLNYFLIGKDKKKHALIIGFNRFMYDHLLHHGRKHFCR